jgi:hypothetical protein
MKTLPFPCRAWIIFATSLALVAANWGPRTEIHSTDGQYSVRILDTQLPGADDLFGDRTIAIYRGEEQLSVFPTTGWLGDAYWSPNGQFVAVNNRRGNSGDYLWVFSLRTGKAIKEPDDSTKTARARVRRVAAKFPDYTYDKLDRDHVYGLGWRSAAELKVGISVRFFHTKVPTIEIDDVYRVDEDHLTLIEERIHRE